MSNEVKTNEPLNPFTLGGSSPPLNEWMTAPEAACYLRMSIKTLYNLKCDGKIKGYNRGKSKKGTLLFKKNDLDAFVVGKAG